MTLRVLVACEYSGRVRSAFRALGHDAWSADLLPAEDGALHHIQGDVLWLLKQPWDLVIGHPPCTYLTSAAEWAFADPDFERYPDGGYHQRVKSETLTGAARRAARQEAVEFVEKIWQANARAVCIENPKGALPQMGIHQCIQPHWFGDDASKSTVLRLKGLPFLEPTHPVEPRIVDGRPRWGNQTDSGQNKLSPSEDRWKDRSRTYPGIAQAMAHQWSRALT